MYSQILNIILAIILIVLTTYMVVTRNYQSPALNVISLIVGFGMIVNYNSK